MKRRHTIQLGDEEQRDFLRRSKTIILSTIDGNGYPHTVAMWYVVDEDGSLLMTTYAKSQKAINIRRNSKVSLLVESGETYETLKGTLIRGEAELIDDFETRLAVLGRVHRKMTGAFPEGVEEALRRQATKRIVIRVVPQRTTSWDHSKLGGRY
jgi:PPOX class probable F420-dependent enzyme